MAISRRNFIKNAAAASAFLALGVAPKAMAAGPGDKVDNWVKGVCRYCGTGCGVMVGVSNGKVITVKGDPNNHNQGIL